MSLQTNDCKVFEFFKFLQFRKYSIKYLCNYSEKTFAISLGDAIPKLRNAALRKHLYTDNNKYAVYTTYLLLSVYNKYQYISVNAEKFMRCLIQQTSKNI